MTIAWDMGTDLGSNVFIDGDNPLDPLEFVDNLEPWNFTLNIEDAHLSIASFVTLAVDNDKRLQTTYPTHTRSNKQASVTVDGAVNPAYTSSDTTVATVDRNGYIRHVGNGTATITATCRGKERSEAITLSGLPTITNTSYRVTENIDGWVRKHLSDAVDDRLTDGTDMVLYTGTYTRTSNWLDGIDLTCHSPYNSTSGDARRAGVLLTRKHLVAAYHYPIDVGATVRFVAADNTIVDRTVASRTQVPDTDLMIHVLNEEVPATIGFAKVLPADWADYLPSIHQELPCVHIDKQTVAGVVNLHDMLGTTGDYTVVQFGAKYDAVRPLYDTDMYTGNSGSPCFFIIDDELVFVTLLTTTVNGPATHIHIDAINTILNPYTLTYADLFSFRSI